MRSQICGEIDDWALIYRNNSKLNDTQEVNSNLENKVVEITEAEEEKEKKNEKK